MSDYERIARAIEFLTAQVAQQPSLAEVAAQVSLSPFHFQRLFCRWAGISPKRFLQVLTLEHAKRLMPGAGSLLALAEDSGFSSSSRLHDHFVTLEAATPGEYQQQGAGLRIGYGVHATVFGDLFIAATPRGICQAEFLAPQSLDAALVRLARTWPQARREPDPAQTEPLAAALNQVSAPSRPLSLHVVGTNFQVAVWRALLTIPVGAVSSYAEVAAALAQPQAARAVGNAVAANPVAFFIPCHRVILRSGALGQYRWGTVRKQAMQWWEQAQRHAPR